MAGTFIAFHPAQNVNAGVSNLDAPRPVASLWDGLECFPAYGDEMEPAVLASAATAALGVAPVAVGLVDHARIGDEWERSHRAASITDMLLDELGRRP